MAEDFGSVAVEQSRDDPMEYASAGERVAGFFIDYLFLLITAIPILILPDALAGVWALLWMLTIFAHFFVLEGVWKNQTAGKYALNMKVAKDDGSDAGLWNCFVRNIIGILFTGFLGWLVGFFAIYQSEENKRLGDNLAGTVVIKVDDSTED